MFSVILLMAGKGQRMKENVNKIRLPLGNKLVYEYSLDTFLSFNFEVICVLSEQDFDLIPRLPKNVKYTFGGKTRQESVLNGLLLCSNEYVLIHDAARPFISKNVILKIIKSDLSHAKLVYQNVKDTIKINDNGLKTLPRNMLISASTPQCAPLSIFMNVFNLAKKENFQATDDISLIEKYRNDIKIDLILGNEENFKLTTPLDYELAKIIVEMKKW